MNFTIDQWNHGLKNDIEIYSTHNDEKSAVTGKFTRTLKSTICKYTSSLSKNVHIDRLDEIMNECNSKCHRTIKMKPTDVDDNTYIRILTLVKKLMIKILNLKLVIMHEYENANHFCYRLYS